MNKPSKQSVLHALGEMGKLILTTGAVLTMLSGVVVWAGDQRWVTHDKLGKEFILDDIREATYEINDLHDKKELDMLTPLERLRLKRLINRREELKEDLKNAKK